MTTYYKATRPDGTDFHTGALQWAPPAGYDGEWIVRHPTATKVGGVAREYLSVSTAVTDCTGMDWPCRLLTVEAVGDVTAPSRSLPRKRAGVAFRVTGERPAHEALGPQGTHVAALIERARHLTTDEACALAPAWNDAENAAWAEAWDPARNGALTATWDTVWDIARNAAWEDDTRDAAWAAARALIVRDLIATDQYDVLSGPWRRAVGPIHPDDPELGDDEA